MALPSVPYKHALVTNQTLTLTPAWAAFFREVFTRIGGGDAPSITALSTAVTTAQAEVDALQTTVTALNSLYAEVTALTQGRQL